MALEYKFKLVLFGDGGVGKSSLATRYLSNIFKQDIKMTIGVDFGVKKLSIEDAKINLFIWDFGGEERFRVLLPSYVSGASGGIFMYDITRPATLNHINEWIPLFREHTREKIPILMVGGKLDLSENRAIDANWARDVSEKFGLFDHIECSAKTGENVEELFKLLTIEMMKQAH